MKKSIRVVELFAGVGGFRLGLERASERFDTVMANQWEPGKKVQNAAECYALRFGLGRDPDDGTRFLDGDGKVLWSCDVEILAQRMEDGSTDEALAAVPEHELLVGGFPCFLEGTLVITREGRKEIQEIEVGEQVLTHMSRYRRVSQVFKNPLGERSLCCVSLTNGEEVFCTEEHRFWVIIHNEGTPEWVAAKDLKPGYRALHMGEVHYTNEWVPVAEVLPVKGQPEFVYNLEVAEDNSYTANGLAAHNCQDYSVAKPLNQSHGLEGKKGVLWWSIHRILKKRRPPLVLLENVDRLLNSPAKQRGKDFAVILATLSDLDYTVEWQIVNAADYGFPQRRRRVFILARQNEATSLETLFVDGILSRALPVEALGEIHRGRIEGTPWKISEEFNHEGKLSPFENRGVLRGRSYITARTRSTYAGPRATLGSILQPAQDVSADFETDPSRWAYVKGAKDEDRTHPSGAHYRYKEGALPFPDPLDRPSRTILTSEGGASPSRTTHCVEQAPGVFRRLTPVELERLDGFPDGWTELRAPGKTLSNGQRGFILGNALVVGIIERIARELEKTV